VRWLVKVPYGREAPPATHDLRVLEAWVVGFVVVDPDTGEIVGDEPYLPPHEYDPWIDPRQDAHEAFDR
jgi:hypothetical protein